MHTLDVDGEPSRKLPKDRVRERLDEQLDAIEREVNEASDVRDETERELNRVEDRIDRLKPFRELPLAFEDYHGYETLEVFVGEGPEELDAKLDASLDRYEHFQGAELDAVFVHESEADRARDLLVREGFRNVDVPAEEGTPGDQLRQARRRAEELRSEFADREAQLDQLADQYGDLLLCAEEDLSIVVEKAEAPLDWAATERTFICDAWVPTGDLDHVKSAVSDAANGNVHFETLDEGDPEDHHREEEPPTRYDHSDTVDNYNFLMETFSTPRYNEIDPTLILALVFPLFLGFVIGDFGYGLVMVPLGIWLYRGLGQKSEAARSLGFAIAVAGAWSVLFGGWLFKDALGIPMYHAEHGLSWPSLLGLGGLSEPAIHKIEAGGVRAMLALSLLAAFVHLFLGFIFGFVNELGHSTKHAIAQLGWMVTLTGIVLLTIVHGPENMISGYLVNGLELGEAHFDHGHVESLEFTAFAQMLPWYLIAPGVLVLVLTEGLMGLMETVSLLANVISYTRLAGIAVAKGGIVAAFNEIFLERMVLDPNTGILVIVAGFLLFAIAQLLMFVLGLLSGGIQSIRLNYVEFFLKFFEGGGERFSPFGREREYTVNTESR